jgi:hypothetical protein
LCDACKNLRGNGFSCPAYPSRIPDDIRVWGADHRKIRADQEGRTIFELGNTDKQAKVFDQWSKST